MRRNHAVAGPPPKPPAMKRTSTASVANLGRCKPGKLTGAALFGAGRRRDLLGVRVRCVRGQNLERARPNDLDAVGEHRAVEQLHAPPRAGDLGMHLERPDRRRPDEVVGQRERQSALRPPGRARTPAPAGPPARPRSERSGSTARWPAASRRILRRRSRTPAGRTRRVGGQRGATSSAWVARPTRPRSSYRTLSATPMPPRAIRVSDSRQIHSPTGSRSMYSVRSGLMYR